MARKRPVTTTRARLVTTCPLNTNPDRLAAGIDPAASTAELRQLRRASGQVDGIKRMIEQQRGCDEVIVQITAVRASLKVVAELLLKSRFKAMRTAASTKGPDAYEAMFDELVDLARRVAK